MTEYLGQGITTAMFMSLESQLSKIRGTTKAALVVNFFGIF